MYLVGQIAPLTETGFSATNQGRKNICKDVREKSKGAVRFLQDNSKVRVSYIVLFDEVQYGYLKKGA